MDHPMEPRTDDRKMFRFSLAEMERRWGLVHAWLREQGAQALLTQGYEDKIGGNVKWLTDIPSGYPRTVIVPVDGLMSVIDSGTHKQLREPGGRDPDQPGVGRVVTTWAFQTAHYTHRLNAEASLAEIRRLGCTRIAVANAGMMPHGFVAALEAGLAGKAAIVDATDFLDGCKARKSAEEIVQIRYTAATQDAVFARLLGFIRPGLRDFEVNAFIDHQLQLLGAERGTYIGRAAPEGSPSSFAYRHFQGRTIRAGDHVTVLLGKQRAGRPLDGTRAHDQFRPRLRRAAGRVRCMLRGAGGNGPALRARRAGGRHSPRTRRLDAGPWRRSGAAAIRARHGQRHGGAPAHPRG